MNEIDNKMPERTQQTEENKTLQEYDRISRQVNMHAYWDIMLKANTEDSSNTC